MSWRETLGITPTNDSSHAHNTHNSYNSQNPADMDNCTDITDCTYGNQGKTDLSASMPKQDTACVTIPVGKKGECKPESSPKEEKAIALLTRMRNQIESGICPPEYDQPAYCRGCGSVWLWFSGNVLGCPWCWNRAANRPIPRPCAVRCIDCNNFERIEHPHLGHCTQNQTENIAGLWDEDSRYCEYYIQSQEAPLVAKRGQQGPNEKD